MGHPVPVISGTCTNSVFSSLPPLWAKEDSTSPRVLHKNLLLHSQARWARAWVEVEARAHKLGLQGPKGMSKALHLRPSLQIN